MEEGATQISLRWPAPDLRDLPDLLDLLDLVDLVWDLAADVVPDLVAGSAGVAEPVAGSPVTESGPFAARIGALIGVVVVVVVVVTGIR